jgi:hypothetical protein
MLCIITTYKWPNPLPVTPNCAVTVIKIMATLGHVVLWHNLCSNLKYDNFGLSLFISYLCFHSLPLAWIIEFRATYVDSFIRTLNLILYKQFSHPFNWRLSLIITPIIWIHKLFLCGNKMMFKMELMGFM